MKGSFIFLQFQCDHRVCCLHLQGDPILHFCGFNRLHVLVNNSLKATLILRRVIGSKATTDLFPHSRGYFLGTSRLQHIKPLRYVFWTDFLKGLILLTSLFFLIFIFECSSSLLTTGLILYIFYLVYIF